MKRQELSLVVCPFGRTDRVFNEASAHASSTERTFSENPRVGWLHYQADLTTPHTFAFEKGIPYRAGSDFGYRLSHEFAMGAQADVGRFAALSPHLIDGEQIGISAGRSVRKVRRRRIDTTGALEGARQGREETAPCVDRKKFSVYALST